MTSYWLDLIQLHKRSIALKRLIFYDKVSFAAPSDTNSIFHSIDKVRREWHNMHAGNNLEIIILNSNWIAFQGFSLIVFIQ